MGRCNRSGNKTTHLHLILTHNHLYNYMNVNIVQVDVLRPGPRAGGLDGAREPGFAWGSAPTSTIVRIRGGPTGDGPGVNLR